MTQECDLDHDYYTRWAEEKSPKKNKQLFSILVAPLYNFQHVLAGEHLDKIEKEMNPISDSTTERRKIVQNDDPRYHFIKFPDDIPIPLSLVDFKHYFSVNVQYLKALRGTNFICRISPLFRDDISHRFASFLARIGLPQLR